MIIGGTGFFGKSILDSFKRGLLNDFNITKILVLARNTDKFKVEFPELNFDRVELINGDISSVSSLPEADLVIHAATSTNMNDYNQKSNNAGKNNIEKAVSNYCILAPNFHSNSKILYCSSGAVYGKQPLNIEKIDENFPLQQDISDLSNEKQNYCLGKRFAEIEIKKLGSLGLNVSIARCFAFSGKYLPKDQHYAYGNFIASAEKGDNIIVKSNGIIYRSYMSADEMVFSLIKILFISKPTCPIYNVGSDKIEKIHEVALDIAKKFGVRCEFKIDYNLILDRYVPDINKLKLLLNEK